MPSGEVAGSYDIARAGLVTVSRPMRSGRSNPRRVRSRACVGSERLTRRRRISRPSTSESTTSPRRADQVGAVPGAQRSGGQRQPAPGDHQADDHLPAVGAVVPRVAAPHEGIDCRLPFDVRAGEEACASRNTPAHCHSPRHQKKGGQVRTRREAARGAATCTRTYGAAPSSSRGFSALSCATWRRPGGPGRPKRQHVWRPERAPRVRAPVLHRQAVPYN